METISNGATDNDIEPSFTKSEKRLLKRDWKTLKPNIPSIGVIAFINLFENHPDVHEAFTSFRKMQTKELRYNMILRSHALRVMDIVDRCICSLDDRPKLKETVTELGHRHGSIQTVKTDFMDLMGPQAIEAIKPHLEGVWDKEHEVAWENLFKLIAYHMKRGIASA